MRAAPRLRSKQVMRELGRGMDRQTDEAADERAVDADVLEIAADGGFGLGALGLAGFGASAGGACAGSGAWSFAATGLAFLRRGSGAFSDAPQSCVSRLRR